MNSIKFSCMCGREHEVEFPPSQMTIADVVSCIRTQAGFYAWEDDGVLRYIPSCSSATSEGKR